MGEREPAIQCMSDDTRSKPPGHSAIRHTSQVVRSPYLIRPSAALLLQSKRESRIGATIGKCPGSHSLALLVTGKMTLSRVAPVLALQTIGIIVGITWLSRCR